MRINRLWIVMGLLPWLCCACIRDEAPNAEADIERCILPENILSDAETDYTLPYDETQNAYPLYVEVLEGTDLTALAPEFELTPGATIVPESGSVHDFTTPIRYTVTSEDGKWHRTYVVHIRYPESRGIPTVFHFEDFRIENKYGVFYEEASGYSTVKWASGNQGFSLTGGGSTPEDYPTYMDENGFVGKCVRLTTRTTGDLGQRVGKPIAAGNLFLGRFELLNAVGDALGATKFGVTFYRRPLRLKGYYKYQAGPLFYEDGNYTDRKDMFDLYAIFYEKSADVSVLDGHIALDGFSHPNLVAIARIENPKETLEWTHFDQEFDYVRYGNRVIDPDKLRAGQYNISIIMSSSKDGDQFKGAPGSTLWVDEVELECE